MELSQLDKNLLSILDDNTIEGIIFFAKKHLSVSKEEVKESLDKLLSLGLIEKILMPKIEGEKETDVYFRTNKVTQEMLNKDIHYNVEINDLLGQEIKIEKMGKFKGIQKDKGKK